MSEQGSIEFHIPTWTVADRLRKAREDAGLTQRQLADLTELSENTIGNYETGQTVNHRRVALGRWAWATKVPVEWLRDGIAPTNGPDDGPTGHVTSGSPGLNVTGTAKVMALPVRNAEPVAA